MEAKEPCLSKPGHQRHHPHTIPSFHLMYTITGEGHGTSNQYISDSSFPAGGLCGSPHLVRVPLLFSQCTHQICGHTLSCYLPDTTLLFTGFIGMYCDREEQPLNGIIASSTTTYLPGMQDEARVLPTSCQ